MCWFNLNWSQNTLISICYVVDTHGKCDIPLIAPLILVLLMNSWNSLPPRSITEFSQWFIHTAFPLNRENIKRNIPCFVLSKKPVSCDLFDLTFHTLIFHLYVDCLLCACCCHSNAIDSSLCDRSKKNPDSHTLSTHYYTSVRIRAMQSIAFRTHLNKNIQV